jgi:hypothetical protein
MAPAVDIHRAPPNAHVLRVPGDRAVRVEFTDREIFVTAAKNGAVIARVRRTIEWAEAIADTLSAARLVHEAEALRRECQRWRW